MGKTGVTLVDDVEVVLEGLGRVEAADDVQFGDAHWNRFLGSRQGFLDGHEVCFGVVFVAAEGTEPAAGDTDVGKVDVTVDIEIGIGPALPLLCLSGQSPETEEVGFFKKKTAVFRREPLPAYDFLLDCVHVGLLIHRCNASGRVWTIVKSARERKIFTSMMWKISILMIKA